MGMVVLFISVKCTQCNNACSGSEKYLGTYCTKCTVTLHCKKKKKTIEWHLFSRNMSQPHFKLKKCVLDLSWRNYTLHALAIVIKVNYAYLQAANPKPTLNIKHILLISYLCIYDLTMSP